MAINDGTPILVKANDSKAFYINFFHMFKEQLKIKHLTDIHVLTAFCIRMEFNSSVVKLVSKDRKEICADLKIQNTHLSNSIRRLKDLDLISGEDGSYELNPHLTWKGNLKEREKLLATKGIEIRVRFAKSTPTEPYNPMLGGSREFDA